MGFDISGPCYTPDFDTSGKTIYERAKSEPTPYPNEDSYLKKLSTIMGLPKNDKNVATTTDSIAVQFVILANGQLTGLEWSNPDKPGPIALLNAIKQHSCVWPAARDGNKYPFFRRRLMFFYTKDKKGDIHSLNRFEYR